MIAAQAAEIVDLKARLAKNSSNSSLPPSQDPPGVLPNTVKRKSKRRRGGQPGHKRHDRQLVPDDRILERHELIPTACAHCGTALVGQDPEPRRHQVVDIPPVIATATEYRLHALCCAACGTTTRADLPDHVSSRVFGPRLTAIVALLSGNYRLSKRLVETLLSDLFAIDLSLGSVSNLEQESAATLEPAYNEAADEVKRADYANADETGWTEAKKRAWLWLAVSAKAVVFMIRRSRGAKSARELLGSDFKGILGSDRWDGYAWVDAGRRQICWAHLIRDFASFSEYGLVATALSDSLLRQSKRMMKLWHRTRDGTLTWDEFRRKMKPVQRKLLAYLRGGAGLKLPKVAGMCREILTLEAALFTFVDEPGVQPTNNAAERALRKAVIWRKVSFGTDSERGSRFVERILSVTATLRLQGRNVLEFLTASIAAHRQGAPLPLLLSGEEHQLALAA